MGHVLEALRQLESKQGPPSPAVPSDQQLAIPDDRLAPPPEYLPDEISPGQVSQLPVAALGSGVLVGLSTSVEVVGPVSYTGMVLSGATAGVPSNADGAGWESERDTPAPTVWPLLRPDPSLTVVADAALPCGAYDELAETILAQIVPGRPAALWFTSVEEGIGRTAMVASLAAALARRESRGVLAVDADFRRPKLGSHFDVPPNPGLAGVLCGRVPWEEAIGPTEIPSLFVLPAGRADSGGPEKGDSPHLYEAPSGPFRQMGTVPFFLPAERLLPLLEQWCGRFRLVLVDAPSLIRPETASLSRHFHGTYLALRLGRTRQRALRRALQALEAAGGRLLGSILLGPPVTG